MTRLGQLALAQPLLLTFLAAPVAGPGHTHPAPTLFLLHCDAAVEVGEVEGDFLFPPEPPDLEKKLIAFLGEVEI